MKHTKIYSFLIIISLVILSLGSWNYLNEKDSRTYQHESELKTTIQCSHEDETLCTHLPIIVIDTKEQIMETAQIEHENIEGINYEGIYLEGLVSVIDNESEYNHIKDESALSSGVMIKYRGNSSMYFEKKQYLIKFINESGEEAEYGMMGMSTDNEWVLNGNFMDKSFMRNYLCYSVAGEIMEYSPDSRFCEVVTKNGDEYTYQDLYLMTESIKRDSEKVDIRKYDPKLPTTSYIVRRDRFNPDENILMTFGTENNLTDEFIGLKYPSKTKVDEKTLAFVANDISFIEEIMYSEEGLDLDRLSDYINLDSFVDYFIINELFGNYDAGLYSTYSYKDLGGKLKMGPVWDFDRSMDNDPAYIMDIGNTVINNYSWYDTLFTDKKFTDRVVKRYKKLRQTVLSDEYLTSFIDDTALYISLPVERNNHVWGYIYEMNLLNNIPDSNGNIVDRNSPTFEDEIDRMKGILTSRGSWLDENIEILYDYSTDSNKDLLPDNLNALLFIATFLISIIIVKFE